ncbi:sulfite exporter TauE/SafE family protein [Mobiluncus mulieris]|uniref:sulfite exporter TauE/SafE family protein n=2 Tax=Mobiluncus mulieris TaxID=2052 RepID=UPI000E040E3A|nr:sulfite exporter TauE/SafE family protein [Mobiluncus mulieris]STY84116.1 Sulfite exporter TauE/SafE [Mobiluncus mulieris]
MEIVFVIAMTLLGACVQGVAGMGFGLTTVPVFIWFFGPIDGVVMGNILGLVNSITLGVMLRRDINWPIVGLFVAAQTPAIIITILLLSVLPLKSLEVTIGLLMLVMVAAAVFSFKLPRVYGKKPVFFFAALAGALSAAVAQSGPAVTAYAQTSRWGQKQFSASMQPIFAAMNLVVVPTKYLTGMAGASGELSWSIVGILVLAVLVGNFVSIPLRQIVKSTWARNLAIFLGGVGAVRVLWHAFSL